MMEQALTADKAQVICDKVYILMSIDEHLGQQPNYPEKYPFFKDPQVIDNNLKEVFAKLSVCLESIIHTIEEQIKMLHYYEAHL